MNIVQISGWQTYLRDGEQFLATARAAFRKGSKGFSPETLYNLICMGIEKLIMAFLMKNGDLAENHTMADLLRCMEKHLPADAAIAEKLLLLDSFQEICDPDSYVVKKATQSDVADFLQTGDDLYAHLSPHLLGEAAD